MKKSTLDQITQKQFQLVLTYAPAGLGHLRIMDSLYHGLPKAAHPIIMGSQDTSIQTLHRITSIHPLARAAFEWFQSGPLADLANRLYRFSLRWNTGVLYKEMSRLIDERFEPTKKILVVSTHFGLAHKLAVIKDKLQKERQVKIVLVVFVSDDTFQHIWYVDGADLLVVASHFIKRKYVAYGKRIGKSVKIKVISYPLNPRLKQKLDPAQMKERIKQLEAKGKTPIQISIPISGAAVGTEYFSKLIAGLHEKSERFHFHIVSKDAPFTKIFLSHLARKPWVDLHVGKQDREVVDHYDTLMDQKVIALEVTKPSEQAFKALLGTQSRGGVILLFSEPVGQQEWDNLDFLGRHYLVPSRPTNEKLWAMAENNVLMESPIRTELFEESRTWRGVRLPNDSHKAADFIWWMHTSGIFTNMLLCNMVLRVRDGHSDVLGSNGVSEFWDLGTSV